MAKGKSGAEGAAGKNKPAHEVRIGKIRCAVWANEHPDQGTWYSVTFSRTYTAEGGREKNAQSFGRDDLLVLGEVSRQAFLWIARQQGGGGITEEPPSEAPPG